MSDLKSELSKEDQERYANGLPTLSQRRKGLFALSGITAAGTLAVVFSLPSGQEVKPDVYESFKNEDIILFEGTVLIDKKANIRTSEEISASNPNTVDWNSIETENGSLSEADAIRVTNAVITFGHNPDSEQTSEQNEPGEWINFSDTQGRWLKVSLSDKTAGLVHTEEGKRISGHPNKDGGFLTEDKSTSLSPEEIAVVELVKID